MKLNEKGFTLIEVLAVVVILSVLMAIMVPSVNSLIKKNQNDNYEALKNSLLSATKMYLSDYRYEVTVTGYCSDATTTLEVSSVNSVSLTNSNIPIKTLVNNDYIKTTKGEIYNPKSKNQKLDQQNSYVSVKYNCQSKDFTYTLQDSYLKWN